MAMRLGQCNQKSSPSGSERLKTAGRESNPLRIVPPVVVVPEPGTADRHIKGSIVTRSRGYGCSTGQGYNMCIKSKRLCESFKLLRGVEPQTITGSLSLLGWRYASFAGYRETQGVSCVHALD